MVKDCPALFLTFVRMHEYPESKRRKIHINLEKKVFAKVQAKLSVNILRKFLK